MYIILTKKYKNLLQWNKIDSKVKIYISHKATEKRFYDLSYFSATEVVKDENLLNLVVVLLIMQQSTH